MYSPIHTYFYLSRVMNQLLNYLFCKLTGVQRRVIGISFLTFMVAKQVCQGKWQTFFFTSKKAFASRNKNTMCEKIYLRNQ